MYFEILSSKNDIFSLVNFARIYKISVTVECDRLYALKMYKRARDIREQKGILKSKKMEKLNK